MDDLWSNIVLEKSAKLLESNADVLMASKLDIEEMLHTSPEDPASPQEPCSNVSCRRTGERLERQEQQIVKLREELEQATKDLRLLRRQNRLLQSRLSRKLLTTTKRLQEEMENNNRTFTPASQVATEPPPYPDHVPQLNELLEDFQKHQEGPDPSTKLKNSVQSQVCQIKRFLGFMAVGKSHLATLEFLDNPSRIREWVSSLNQQTVVASRLGHCLKNVAQFIAYVGETSPSSSDLKQTSLLDIGREIRGIIKDQRRSMVAHQTKESGNAKAISKAVLLRCRERAREDIPRILARLTQNRSIKAQWSFYGHLMAYLSCIYGHQSEVFQNLTVEEVVLAKHDPETDVFLVNVETHKMNQAYGVTHLLLTAEEFSWFKDFLAVKPRLPGGETSKYFFFSPTSNPCINLNDHLQAAWAHMDLPGKPTFTDIRTTIATSARNALSSEDWAKVARFLCHNTATENKFFALNLNPKEAAECRGLFESLLQGEEKKEEEDDEEDKTRRKNKRKQKTPEKYLFKKLRPLDEDSGTSADGTEVRYQRPWDLYMEEEPEESPGSSQHLEGQRKLTSTLQIPNSQRKPDGLFHKVPLFLQLKEVECSPELNPAEILEFEFNREEQRVKEEEVEDDPFEILEFVYDGDEHVKEDTEDTEDTLQSDTEDQHTLQNDKNTQTHFNMPVQKKWSGDTTVKEEDSGGGDDVLLNPESVHSGVAMVLKDEIKKESEVLEYRLQGSPEAAEAMMDVVERPFCCSQCGKSFRTCSSLKLHQKCHSDKRPFSCLHCGRSFMARGHLKQHMLTHTGGSKKLYTCSRCGSRFESVLELKSHKKIHTGEKPYCCSECGKHLTTRESLLYHMRIHTGEKPYQCDMCGKAFRSAPVLKEHKRIHTGEKPFECPQCGRSFSKKRHLSSHVLTHTGEKPYQCFQCGKSFSRTTSLKIHQITHTGEKPFICTECGMRFTTRGSLGYHMRIHTGDKPHECLQCGKSYARPGHLRIHMMSHTGEKPFSCSQCGKSFLYHGSFQAHMTIHTGEKPFTCGQCGKKSSTLRLHKSHMTIHDAEKPFTCSQCGKSFSHPSGFKAHLRVHSGEKPFMCDQCGRSFSHLSSLTVHLRTHTGEQPFACSQCGKTFAKSGPFRSHLREHCESNPPPLTYEANDANE